MTKRRSETGLGPAFLDFMSLTLTGRRFSVRPETRRFLRSLGSLGSSAPKKKMTFREFGIYIVVFTALAILFVGWWNGRLSPAPKPTPQLLPVASPSPSPSPEIVPSPSPSLPPLAASSPSPSLPPLAASSPSPSLPPQGEVSPPLAAVTIGGSPASSSQGEDSPGGGNVLEEDTGGEVVPAAAGGGIDAPSLSPSPLVTPVPSPSPAPSPSPDPDEPTYILNLNSKKFHYPYCRSVEQIKPKNYEAFFGTREEAIARGFDPCKICNP